MSNMRTIFFPHGRVESLRLSFSFQCLHEHSVPLEGKVIQWILSVEIYDDDDDYIRYYSFVIECVT